MHYWRDNAMRLTVGVLHHLETTVTYHVQVITRTATVRIQSSDHEIHTILVRSEIKILYAAAAVIGIGTLLQHFTGSVCQLDLHTARLPHKEIHFKPSLRWIGEQFDVLCFEINNERRFLRFVCAGL